MCATRMLSFSSDTPAALSLSLTVSVHHRLSHSIRMNSAACTCKGGEMERKEASTDRVSHSPDHIAFIIFLSFIHSLSLSLSLPLFSCFSASIRPPSSCLPASACVRLLRRRRLLSLRANSRQSSPTCVSLALSLSLSRQPLSCDCRLPKQRNCCCCGYSQLQEQ